MRTASLLVALVLLIVSGCSGPRSTAQSGDRDAARANPAGMAPLGDVMLDGVSLVGAWYAVEVEGDRRASRDLEDGTLETTLLIEPNGRAILTGIDRREGDGAVTFVGQIATNRVTFRGMDGAGTLIVSGRRLILRDPRGRRTVFVRGTRGG